MSLLGSIGKRHLQLGRIWQPTMALYGSAGVGVFLYFTEWKAVLKYVPLYGSKYEKESTK